jgi:hypothetical protein
VIALGVLRPQDSEEHASAPALAEA